MLEVVFVKEIDLSALYKIVKERWLPTTVAGILCAVLAFSYNKFFVAPMYRTSTTILVNNGGLANVGVPGDSVNTNDLNASLYLVETCVDILESDNMYKELANALGGNYSYQNLKGRFVPEARGENSLLIDIYTFGSNQNEIMEIANTFLEVAPTFIKNNILSVDVKVLATADIAYKTGPKILMNTGIACIVGVLGAIIMFILISMFKNTIENEKDFKDRFSVPLLGTVPEFENKQMKGGRNAKRK